jgi:O-antigen ligase
MKPAETIKDNTRSVEQRIESIQNPTEDHSFLMRVELGWYAIQKFLQRPIFGWGLGDFLRYQFLGNPNLKNNYIDNSWLYFLWKGGIIGLSLFVFILYRIIKVSIFILKNSKNKTVKSIVAGIFGGFVGLVALALLSPLFIKYRTNVLIAFFLAYLEFEYNKLKLKQNLN